MARDQAAHRFADPTEPEEQTIPPIRRAEDARPIAAAGGVADLDPAPLTPRPWEEEEEIAQESGDYSVAPPRRSLGISLWLVAGAIVVLGILAWFLSG